MADSLETRTTVRPEQIEEQSGVAQEVERGDEVEKRDTD